ncbi:MAG: RsmB/NOP family class I SAM-dependent RNA methyltransferase [Alphaproteobacteria bacterium]|nr:RsmB/NOP family class I SAM-dependent RNA methyltransferase [Alphaproteobacteria bacterium]
MQNAARINAVIEVLDDIFKFEQPADNTLNVYFRNRRYIGSKDRKEISDIAWQILRSYGRFKAIVSPDKLTPRIAMVLYLKSKKLNVAEYFTGDKYAPLKLENNENFEYKQLEEILECPDWLKGKIDDADLAFMTRPATTDLRVNTLKINREELLERLGEYGAVPTPISPIGIRVVGRPSFVNNELFQEGLFEIQDEGSQIVSLLSNARENERIIDWCAGGGGKTLALAAMMNNTGTLYAADENQSRLKDIPERAMRAGVKNVILLSDYSAIKDQFDLVLVDAPCTGTGTWRRSPDARWRISEKQSQNIIKIQQQILEKSSKAVKVGGRLLYITCSLDKDEDENQISTFLSNHKDFCLADLSLSMQELAKCVVPRSATVKLYPSVYKTDGFFAAMLMRK